MYNITNAANISFTTVYNAESGFTIFYKIYNGSLNILYNVYNTANNTKSGFTIYCKIYNGALRTLTIFTKFTMVLSMYFQILLNMPMLMLI